MRAVRLWSVRHARGLNLFYKLFEQALIGLHPLWQRIGYRRLEAPFQILERATKGFLFDCQMCGQCVLSATGMSCPMNCPKTLRNGPCGGVRANGNCEVKPDMPCVWVKAWEGAARMGAAQDFSAILDLQKPVDHRRKGKSAWLRAIRLAKGLGEEETPAKPAPAAKAGMAKTGAKT